MGMATSLDTLCSQAYTGSRDKKILGLYLQRGIIVCTLTLLPVTVLWWNMGNILVYLNTDPLLVSYLNSYMKWRLVGLFPTIVFECLKKYLQAQGIFKAPSHILLLVTPLGIILNYYLTLNPATSIGFIGAPIAYDISTWLSTILCILYICFVNGSEGWGGFSMKAFEGWSGIFNLGIYGMIHSAAEWWSFGSMAFIVPVLGNASLAAHGVLIALCNMAFMPHLGVAISSSIRVGNQLGSQYPNRARLATLTSYSIALFTGVLSSLVLLVFSDFWATSFSTDPEVIEKIRSLIPIAAFYQLFDASCAVSSGTLRGQGRQKLGAKVVLTGFYLIAIPLGIFLGLKTPLGIHGIWIGFCVGVLISCIAHLIIFLKTDWNEQVRKSIERLNE
jgi:MATE family multidrug resistance protein